MNATPMTLDEIEQLLPFWVNGSLTDAEAQSVKAALAVSDHLRDQERLLRLVHREMQGAEIEPTPGELGLARLNRAIRAEAAKPTPRWLPVAAAAALAAIASAGGTLLLTMRDDVAGGSYVQASGGDAAGALIVAFRPDATQAAIEELLLTNHAHIVDGPSAIGLYRVVPDDGTDVADVSAALLAAGSLVESVGPSE